uniref:Uncharacterized protein n=1 Tax=Rhizophora mucronata TaxID=61149 RepID=A0A2P2MYJ6_RHIMU
MSCPPITPLVVLFISQFGAIKVAKPYPFRTCGLNLLKLSGVHVVLVCILSFCFHKS